MFSTDFHVTFNFKSPQAKLKVNQFFLSVDCKDTRRKVESEGKRKALEVPSPKTSQTEASLIISGPPSVCVTLSAATTGVFDIIYLYFSFLIKCCRRLPACRLPPATLL